MIFQNRSFKDRYQSLKDHPRIQHQNAEKVEPRDDRSAKMIVLHLLRRRSEYQRWYQQYQRSEGLTPETFTSHHCRSVTLRLGSTHQRLEPFCIVVWSFPQYHKQQWLKIITTRDHRQQKWPIPLHAEQLSVYWCSSTQCISQIQKCVRFEFHSLDILRISVHHFEPVLSGFNSNRQSH